jgi:signal transduction histidine kinase
LLNQTATPRRRFEAPIAVQIVAMLIVGVVVGQIVTVLIVTILPPPRPPVYRLGEITASLNGQSARPQYGEQLIRRPGVPPVPTIGGRHAAFVNMKRLKLAALLGVSEDRVALSIDEWRRPFARWSFLGLGLGPGAGPPGAPHDHFGGGRFGGDHPGPDHFGPDRFRPDRFGPPPLPDEPRPAVALGGGDDILFGRFEAALRQPSGEWIVVSPQPDPFPNPWQSRVILWFLACLMVFGPAGYLFARRLVRPITAFAEAAERLGRDPRGELDELGGPSEIGVAARAFNQMHSRLKRYVDDRVAMVGAISHDLRTPLARIRFKAEAAPAAVRESISADIEQMEAMLAAALSFVRDSTEKPERARLDLLSVLECVVDDAASAGGDASLAKCDPVVVEGDALALQRLFANLVDNAIKYGGRAEVGLGAGAGDALVTVADQGPGLAPDELERVFEPFYRGERSRNRDTGGVGLGLAVARSIARGHGGDIELRSSGRGLIAEVRLPLAADAAGRRP